MEITTERMKTAEGVEGYLACPSGRRSPALLVHFEIFGVNGHIEDVCRRLAREGYAALAPDYYWRLEKRLAPYTDVEAAFQLAGSLKDEQVLADAGSCLRYLRSQDFADAEAIGTIGFCMGGRTSVLVAASYPEGIAAAISFYGGGLTGENPRPWQTQNPMEKVHQIQSPLLLFYGDKDQSIPPEHVQKFTARLKELEKNFQYHVYPGAGHGFFCNEREAYNAEASQDAWGKTLAFLEANLRRAKAGTR